MTCGSFCPSFLVWLATKNELGIYCTVTKQPSHENKKLQNPNPIIVDLRRVLYFTVDGVQLMHDLLLVE